MEKEQKIPLKSIRQSTKEVSQILTMRKRIKTITQDNRD